MTPEDEEFLHTLQENIEPAPKKRPRTSVWLPAAVSAAAAAAVLVTCLVVYYPYGDNVEYLANNQVTENSKLELLNQDMKEIDLQIDFSVYTCTVKKTSDKVSGDVLFYQATITDNDSIIQMDIITVCNAKFKFKDFSFKGDTTTAKLDNYSVTYETTISASEEFGINILNAKAEIQKGKEFIYVTNYSELLLSDDGNFLEVLQSIVK